MRSLGDVPPLSLEFDVLDGNDVPDSWVGRKVGIETVTAPGRVVGWLQSKSASRLVVVEDRTSEPRYVPWIAVEVVLLLEQEPEGPAARKEAKQVAEVGRHARWSYRRVALRAYERFLRGPVMVVLAVLAAVSLILTGLLLAPARAQVLPDLTDIVFDVVVDVEQGECTPEGCRNVTFDARLSVDETSTLTLTAEQLADLNAALGAGVFEITVTDAEGNTQTVDDGQTVCLPPGETTVTATVVDTDAVIDALATVLGIDASLIIAEGITIGDLTETFTVEDCPDDGVPPDDSDTGAGDDQVVGDISAGQCLAIINNNSGNQYNASTVQECLLIINDGANGDDDGTGGTTTPDDSTGETTTSDDVIVGTIPDKNLPNTGGVGAEALLSLAIFALTFVGMGSSILQAAIRRDP